MPNHTGLDHNWAIQRPNLYVGAPVGSDVRISEAITIKGVYGREIFETWYKMIAMLENGLDVRGVITHRFAAHDFAAGFDAMRSGQSGKVVLDWRGTA